MPREEGEPSGRGTHQRNLAHCQALGGAQEVEPALWGAPVALGEAAVGGKGVM